MRTYIQHLRHEFVDEAASERFKSTALMPSMKPQRSARAPAAMHTLCRVHAYLWRRGCPLPAVCTPCERPAAGVCVVGVVPRRHPLGGDGGALWRRHGGAQPPPGLELEPHVPNLARGCCSRLPSVRSQAPLRASRSPPAATARCPACRASPLPRRAPPPASPPALAAARGHSRERAGPSLCACMRVTYMSSPWGLVVPPGGSGASMRWPTVTPEPAGPLGSSGGCSRGLLACQPRTEKNGA